MILELYDEDWIDEEGNILYDSPIQLEAESVPELAQQIEEGRIEEFNGIEIVSMVNIGKNELRIEFMMPFSLTHTYHFIDKNEANKRKIER